MLTLQFLPYSEIEHLNSSKRIKRLLSIVKEEKIVLLEGRLKKQEETELIKRTMEEISNGFRGIELSVIYPENKEDALFTKIKKGLISALLGDRQGFTIIGPATIIKEIKQAPNKIQLLTEEQGAPAKRPTRRNGKRAAKKAAGQAG
ncbi:DUF2073 domain-containing protein [Candidatus Woesearchaeota archaeon]|nr:DUF2073 domain-containing protein [Candidatus Woesearchaeota archaeon]